MRALHLIDSITQITAEMAGAVIVSGSHGGVSSASYVVHAPHRPLAVFFNDAGVGKDAAGIQALKILEPLGVLCFCYGHESARIGQARDGLDNGIVRHVNDCALPAFADAVGQPVQVIVKRLRAHPLAG